MAGGGGRYSENKLLYNAFTHLHSVFDFASVVSDDEGGLHDSRELDVAVSFMLTLELVQQGLIGGLGETERDGNSMRRGESSEPQQ